MSNRKKLILRNLGKTYAPEGSVRKEGGALCLLFGGTFRFMEQ